MDAVGVPPEKTAPAAPSEESEAITAWSLKQTRRRRALPAIPITQRPPVVCRHRSGAGDGRCRDLVRGDAVRGAGIPAATAEPPSPSTEPPLPPTPDQQFLTSLGRIGIKPEADAAALIGDGHDVCQALGHREPFNQVVADIQAGAWVNSSQANIETSREFAMAAIDVYCPQYQARAPPPLLRIPPRLFNPK